MKPVSVVFLTLWLTVTAGLTAPIAAAEAGADRADVLRFGITGSNAWVPPLVVTADGLDGIIPDLVTAVMTHAGEAFQAVRIDRRHREALLRTGAVDFDIVSPVWYGDRAAHLDPFLLTDPFLQVRDVVVWGTGAAGIEAVDDLAGQRVGTVIGYFYRDQTTYRRYDFNDERTVLQAVARGTVPFGIVNEESAHHWPPLDRIAVVIGPAHSVGNLHIRTTPDLHDKLPAFNAAIAALQADGTVDRIVRHWHRP